MSKSKYTLIFLSLLFVIFLFGLRPVNAITLNIIKPVNNSVIGSLSFPLNISSSSINSINYTWNNGIKNYSLCTSCGASVQSTITIPRNNSYSILVYGWDAGANLYTNTTLITGTLSNSAPKAYPVTPNYANFSNTVNFKFNVSDDDDWITNVSLYIDSVLNTTAYFNYPITANANNTLNFTVTGLSQGTHTWQVVVSDSNNATGQDTVSNVIVSNLFINSLVNNQEISNNLSFILNTSQNIYNNSVWYSWNNGIFNRSLCTNSQYCQNVVTLIRQGYYNLTVWANDSNNNIASQTILNLYDANRTYQEAPNYSTGDSGWYSYNNRGFDKVIDGNWGTFGQAHTGTTN